jgi:ATP-dependent RNA helicase HelY
VPKHINHRSPQERRDLASSLRNLEVSEPEPVRRKRSGPDEDDEDIAGLRRELRAHPCHACPEREQHARWGERRNRLARENDGLRGRIEGRTGSLGRTFDRICQLLDDRGYLRGEQTTPAGRQLARIWSEADLLVAECLRAGAWDALEPAELAAVVSTLVYEPRRDESVAEAMPTPAVRDALAATVRIWSALTEDEAELGLPRSREPQLGFVWASFRWARQERLDRVLLAAAERGNELPAGDFIRWCKQLLDLLDQIAAAPGTTGDVPPVAQAARVAVTAVRRGVVAQSMSP